MANKKRIIRPRKRKLNGNQHNNSNNTNKQFDTNTGSSTSSKKLKNNLEKTLFDDDEFIFFMHFKQMKSCFEKYATCNICGTKLSMLHDHSRHLGFSLFFQIYCSGCAFKDTFFSSPVVKNNKAGINTSEINVRSVMAFREIGRGRDAMLTFTSIMNMPPPLSKPSFDCINSKLYDAYKSVAEQSMKNAAMEARRILKPDSNMNDVIDCGISIDGTWQRRGYSSLNGVVVATSHDNNKVLDTVTLSKFCKGFQIWERKKGTLKYEQWKVNHSCQVNHTKSAGAMESAGATEIFCSSVNKYNIRYSKYLGDGDTTSFSTVIAQKPYGDDLVPIKLECIGHYQKRTGNRLRLKRKELRRVKLSDGKSISGKGRLTDKVINILQNYVGMAIRQNSNSLLEMRNSVIASLHHCTNFTSGEYRHMFCTKGEKSWCKWQSDRATGHVTYKKKVNLPVAIMEKIKPVFQDLANTGMLAKCLHGMTQNGNEAFNQLIWNRSPKTIFTSKVVVEMAVYSATITYNDGFAKLSSVFDALNIKSGSYFEIGASKKNSIRLKNMNKKMSDETKKKRKKLRSVRRNYFGQKLDKETAKDYCAGGF
nr:uncharacterized protein LOC124806069 [Hydra vulgaris]